MKVAPPRAHLIGRRRSNSMLARCSGVKDASALVRFDSSALAVLLDNAVKYAAPGTPIRLTAVRQGSRAVVSVTDQGPDFVN